MTGHFAGAGLRRLIKKVDSVNIWICMRIRWMNKKNIAHITSAVAAVLLAGLIAWQQVELYDLNKEKDQMNTTLTELQQGQQELTDLLKQKEEEEAGLSLYLPDDIYVGCGITLEIYNDEISSGDNPDNYEYYWDCEIGDCMSDRYHIGGIENDIGEYPLTVKVYDYGLNEVVEASTTLHVVSSTLADKVEVLTIGDSLSNGTPWLSYVRDISDDKIWNVGTKGSEEGAMSEGRAGFSAGDYLGEVEYSYETNEGVQPFYNPDKGTFDWDYYKENTGMNPDMIQIFLGTNGLSMDPTNNVGNIAAIVDAIREADRQIPILVVQTIYPANQDGMANQQNREGFSAIHGMWSVEQRAKTYNLMVCLDEELADKEGVYLVPAAIMHDSDDNFEMKEVGLNPQNYNIRTIPKESIHPSEEGYRQIGDVIASTIYGVMQSK